MNRENFLIENNAKHFWHPMAHPGDMLKSAPKVITSAKGVTLTDVYGHKTLDAVGGLWNVNLGYSCQPVKDAIRNNFKFRKLKAGSIEPYHVFDDRNRKYIGWDAEKITDKIDETIQELKDIKRMNKGSTELAKNNISLMLSNLYFRMKLLADFIKGPK